MRIYRIIENIDPLWSAFCGVIFIGYENTYSNDIAINDLYPDTEDLFFCKMAEHEMRMPLLETTTAESFKVYWNELRSGIIPYIPQKYVAASEMSIDQYKLLKFKVYPPKKLALHFGGPNVYAAIELFKTADQFERAVKEFILYENQCSSELEDIERLKVLPCDDQLELNELTFMKFDENEIKEYWKGTVRNIEVVLESKI